MGAESASTDLAFGISILFNIIVPLLVLVGIVFVIKAIISTRRGGERTRRTKKDFAQDFPNKDGEVASDPFDLSPDATDLSCDDDTDFFDIDDRICPACGSKLSGKENFCENCGHKIKNRE